MAATDPPRAGQIHHVVINVRDLDVSVRFYRDVLGMQFDGSTAVGSDEASAFARIPRGARGRNALLSAGRGMGRIELVEWQDTPSVPESDEVPRRTGADPGLAMVSFLLRGQQLQEMHERVRDEYPCWSEPLTIDVGSSTVRAFVVQDPDGVPVEFFSLDEPQ